MIRNKSQLALVAANRLKPLEQPCNKAAEREAEQPAGSSNLSQQAGRTFEEQEQAEAKRPSQQADKSKLSSRLLALFFISLF